MAATIVAVVSSIPTGGTEPLDETVRGTIVHDAERQQPGEHELDHERRSRRCVAK